VSVSTGQGARFRCLGMPTEPWRSWPILRCTKTSLRISARLKRLHSAMVHELRTSMPAFKSTRTCWTRYCVHNSCSEVPGLPTFRHPGSRGEATWQPNVFQLSTLDTCSQELQDALSAEQLEQLRQPRHTQCSHLPASVDLKLLLPVPVNPAREGTILLGGQV